VHIKTADVQIEQAVLLIQGTPACSAIGGFEDVAGVLRADPDDIGLVWIDSSAENRDDVTSGTKRDINTLVAGKPGRAVIGTYVKTGPGVGNIPEVSVGEMLTDVVAQAANRATGAKPGLGFVSGISNRLRPNWQ